MAVNYKVKKYVNSKSEKNGQFYAKAVVTGSADLDYIADRIQQNCSLKKSDVKACLTELVEVMTDLLQDSKRVRLNGFGSFKMGVSSKLQEKAEDVKASTITGVHVNFLPEYTVDATGQRSTLFLKGARVKEYGEYEMGVNDNA